MPLPTPSDVHVNRLLTNVSVAYMQSPSNFACAQAVPLIPVQKQADIYSVYTRSYFYRRQMAKRAAGAESAGGGYAVDNTNTYFCDKWALHRDITDDERANQDQPYDADKDTTEFLSLQALLNMEYEFASEIFKTATWTGGTSGADVTPGTLWDASGGDPIADILGEMAVCHGKTGYTPNTLIVGHRAWNEGFLANDAVLDRIRYTQRGVVTEDLVASVLGLKQVIVAKGVANTAAEGAAESVSAITTEEDALLAYVEMSPSLLKPSAYYGFAWRGLMGAGPMAQRIKRFRMEQNAADRIEIEQAFDLKIVAADLGVYFDGTVT